MTNYIIRRLLYTIPILIGITLITFFFFNVVGGDPVAIMLGKHANPQMILDLRHEMGLDRPLLFQYFDFLKQIITFNFGRSYASKQLISEMILRGAPVSFSYALPAFLISMTISIALSLFVAFWRGSLYDRIIVIIAVMGLSVPSLAYILFGQYWLAYKWGIFPISGYQANLPEVFSYIALPIIITVILSIGGELRFYRTVMLDEISQDYIRTARSKGLSEGMVMFKHVLKNAMIPIITNVVIEIPFLVSGSILLENFFGIPGLGNQIVEALNTSDFPVIKAQTIIFSLLYCTFNLLTDILYSLVDPRVSLK